MKVVVPLVTVVVLTVVLATQQQQVEFRTPHKIYSNVGNPIRFDFNVLSLNKNVSILCHISTDFINVRKDLLLIFIKTSKSSFEPHTLILSLY